MFTFSGLYAENSLKRGISGVFYLRINYQTKELINQGFIPFESEKINKNWSIGDNRYIKRYGNGNEPELYNYRLRNMEVLKDGALLAQWSSIMCILEPIMILGLAHQIQSIIITTTILLPLKLVLKINLLDHNHS